MNVMNVWKKILGGVLALAMLLSALSLCVIAEETEETPEEPAVPVYEEYLERFDGKTLEDVAIVNKDTPNSAKINPAAVDVGMRDRVVQMELTASAPEPYYLWKDRNNKWSFTEYKINADGTLSGTANFITVENAKINTDATTDYVTVNGTKYYVVTGTYAEAQGGYLGNISQPLILKNGGLSSREGKFTFSLDLYLSSTFNTLKGITGRISVVKASGGKSRLELFAITAQYGYGTFNMHGNSVLVDGGPVDIELGKWNTLTFVVDRTTARVEAYLNGAYAFTAENKASASLSGVAVFPLAVAPDSFELEIARMNNPSELAGYFQADNLQLYHGEPDGDFEQNVTHQNFESVMLGSEPALGIFDLGVSGSAVTNGHGSKAWNIPVTEGNVGKTPRFYHVKYSYEDFESLVIAADYFIEKDSKGTLENRLKELTAFVGEDAVKTTRLKKGIGLYRFLFEGDGKVTLAFEGAGDTAPDAMLNSTLSLSADTWIRTATVLDLAAGTYDLYVNGELAFDNVPFYHEGNRLANLSVIANSIILGSVGAGAEVTEGNVQIDNVSIYPGHELRTPAAAQPILDDLEAYADRDGFYLRGIDVPTLARYVSVAGNTAISLNLSPLRDGSGWALLEENGSSVFSYDVEWDPEYDNTYVLVPGDYFNAEEEFDVEFDEELGIYYAPIDMGTRANPDVRNFYIVPNCVAESAILGANVGRGISFEHGIYSYADTEKVVFSADYLLAEGSVGTVASTLEGFYYGNTETYGASLISLWSANAETGQLEGTEVFLEVGVWNNLTAVLNLRTGVYDLYLNGRFVYTRESGRTDITIGHDETSQWNIATSVPHASVTGLNDGEILVDNVRVDANAPEGPSQYDESFFDDAAYFNYLSDVLISLATASIRLEAPNGLRFATEIDEALMAEITEKFTVVAMGTLITPLDIAESAGGVTHEALNALEGDANYLDIAYEEDFDGAAGLTFSEGRHFTASVVNIKEENLARDFVGVAYLTIAIDEETELTFYADGTVCNVSDVAAAALADENAVWTDGERAILESLVAESDEAEG